MGRRSGLMILCFVTVLAGTLIVPLELRADWPVARQNARRTGAATGKSNITKPAAYWRYYLGGKLRLNQVMMLDVNGDKKREILLATGGRLTARRTDDAVLWQTPTRGIGIIWAAADLDGDGKLEIVASSSDRAYVISALTGKIEWAEPAGEMGTLTGVRVGDLDGDGLPELLMHECACCSVNSKNPGYVYSFAKGLSAPKLLWKLPFAHCWGSNSLVLADLDGTAPAEVLLGQSGALSVLDGKTGKVLATGPSMGTYTQMSHCRNVNLDGKAGDEIVCAQNTSVATKDRRKVYALQYVAGSTPALKLLWKMTVAPDEGGDAYWTDLVADLDGDAKMEVLVSGKDASGVWTTWVLDALSGKQLAKVLGEKAVGTAALEHKQKRLLITESKSTLTAWLYTPGASPAISVRYYLKSMKVHQQPDRKLMSRSMCYSRPAVLDLDGDGLQDLVATTTTQPSELHVYSGKGGKKTLLASRKLSTGVEVSVAWAVPPVTGTTDQVALARTDGYLQLHDSKLVPATTSGLRVGGYYGSGGWRQFSGTPRVGKLDTTGPDAVVVGDSRGALLRLDGKLASMAAPPKKLWEKRHSFTPSIVAGLDKTKTYTRPGIASFGLVQPVTSPPSYQIQALRGDGTAIWSKPMSYLPFNDMLAGNVNKDGIPDLFFQWGSNADTQLRTRAISGKTGAVLWNSTPIELKGGRLPAGLSVTDWNNDGYDDVVFQAEPSRVLSGMDGAQVTKGGAAESYFMLTLHDTNSDKTDEVIYHGGAGFIRVYKKDLTTLVWKSSDDERPYPYAAVASCSGGAVLVSGSSKYAARLKLTPLSGSNLGKSTSLALAGGKKYASEAAATTAGAFLGKLTSVTAHANLTGKGRPSALVGSTEGWLYAIDPCKGELDFALQFPSSVGAPVYGDTDGDGRDEVLVTVADGYLYGLKHRALDSPSSVLDIDPDKGNSTSDVDKITTSDKLSATWTAVAAAKEYKVAVVDQEGLLISKPAWKSVGLQTKTSLSGLPLTDGATYYFAVQAVGQDGPSVDTVSDGVVVTVPVKHDGLTDAGGEAGAETGVEAGPEAGPVDAAPDAGPHQPTEDCDCRVSDGGSGVGVLLLLLAALVRSRRRRRG